MKEGDMVGYVGFDPNKNRVNPNINYPKVGEIVTIKNIFIDNGVEYFILEEYQENNIDVGTNGILSIGFRPLGYTYN